MILNEETINKLHKDYKEYMLESNRYDNDSNVMYGNLLDTIADKDKQIQQLEEALALDTSKSEIYYQRTFLIPKMKHINESQRKALEDAHNQIQDMQERLDKVKEILQKTSFYYDAHVMYENIKMALEALPKTEGGKESER